MPPLIGPERVPWRWYDLILPSFLLLLNVITLFSGLGGKSAATSAITKDLTDTQRQRLLLLSFVVNVAVYAVILLFIWLFSVRKYHVGWSALGMRKVPGRYFAAMIPVVGLMYIAVALVGAAVNRLFYGGKAENPQIDSITGGGKFSWVAVVTAVLTASILAPFVEELLFRGMWYGYLRTRWHNIVFASLGSGAIFSLAHGIPLLLASLLVVGVTLAIVYEVTKSTLVTMTLHSLFNTVSLVLTFVTLARGGSLT